jgi:hypothetical protein
LTESPASPWFRKFTLQVEICTDPLTVKIPVSMDCADVFKDKNDIEQNAKNVKADRCARIVFSMAFSITEKIECSQQLKPNG